MLNTENYIAIWQSPFKEACGLFYVLKNLSDHVRLGYSDDQEFGTYVYLNPEFIGGFTWGSEGCLKNPKNFLFVIKESKALTVVRFRYFEDYEVFKNVKEIIAEEDSYCWGGYGESEFYAHTWDMIIKMKNGDQIKFSNLSQPSFIDGSKILNYPKRGKSTVMCTA